MFYMISRQFSVTRHLCYNLLNCSLKSKGKQESNGMAEARRIQGTAEMRGLGDKQRV